MTRSARTILALGLVSVTSAAASAQAPGFGGVNVRQVPTASPPPSYVLARPVIQPATVFLPPVYDPFVSPFVAVNPVNPFAPIDVRPSDLPTWNRPAFTPPVVTLPVVVGPTVTAWGVLPARVLPGVVTPATVSTVEPGRYLPYTSWFAVNPATGSLFNGVNNTFFRTDGMYIYNPWTNRYEEPVSGSRFDPRTGVTTRPIGGRFPTVFR
jgi:hypothetical protein